MTATLTNPTVSSSTTRARTGRKVWTTGLLAGGTAAVATSVVAGVAHATGVSLGVSGDEIPVLGFAELTFIFSLVGVVLAVAMNRWARSPQRTFVVTTIALTALSLVPDVLADAAPSTRVLLAATHLVAAAIVIPALASRLDTTQ